MPFRLAVLCLIALVFAGAARAEPPLRIGVLAERGSERSEETWQPTLRALAAGLGGRRVVATPYDIAGLTEAVRSQAVDFVITNPGQYVELEAAWGISRIATLETERAPHPSAALASAVIVAAGRHDLRRLEDLKGRRVAAVAPDAFGGFRLALRELVERGIDPAGDGITLAFVGFPIEKVVRAVVEGRADAGIVRACLVEQMIADGELADGSLTVLEGRVAPELGCRISTRLYPNWPFAKLAATPATLAKQVEIALLSMPPTGGDSWTVPVDYQPVHELFRVLKVGPYEYLNHRSVEQMVRAYWPILALAVAVLAWWLLHTARVEHLVRQRTRQLEEAHAEARRQREEREHGARLALLGEMVSSLAHELGQPLAAIANYAKGCQQRQGHDPAGVADGLRRIGDQAERAADIIRRIRAFVRKRAPEPEPIDLNHVVDGALALFQPVVRRQGIVCTVEMAQSRPVVLADRLLVEQVMLNLLKNAADALAGRSPALLAVTTQTGPDFAEIIVADNGPGLPEAVRANLFQPFFTTKSDGVGLGLSLSRSIAEALGGRLWAEDCPGGGARFRLTLPLARQDGDHALPLH